MAVSSDIEKEIRDRVEKALDRVRPVIEGDGGFVDLVDVKDGVASVRMGGACRGCPMSRMTLQMGIEYVIREAAPEIEEVVAVEDEE